MIKSYFKIAYRNLKKHKSYTLINLSGLTIGIVCCTLIALYVREELSFDTFHKKIDRIVSIGMDNKFSGQSLITPYPLADVIKHEISNIEKTTRIKTISKLHLSNDGQTFYKVSSSKYADSEFFDIFSFPLVKGNKETALEGPGKIVLTQKLNDKFFPDANPIGKTIFLQKPDTLLPLVISGIVADHQSNSSISFEALISFNTLEEWRRQSSAWRSYSYQTFALLKKSSYVDSLSNQINASIEKYYNKSKTEYFAKPFSEIHLSNLGNSDGFTGNSKYLYIFSSIAIFILLIACINYVNLATARVSIRIKEVGIRKSLGADRKQIALQFLGESIFLVLGAYLISLFLSNWLIPYFNNIFGANLHFYGSEWFLVFFAAFILLIGFISGIYPAMYLSSFNPISTLRGHLPSGAISLILRKGLVISQFSIAIILIIGSLILYQQLLYTQDKDLGFDGENIVIVELPNREIWSSRETISEKLSNYSGILSASIAGASPGSFNIRMSHKIGDLVKETSNKPTDTAENSISIAPAIVDYKYLQTLNIELLAGRDFSKEISTDYNQAIIINAELATLLGWTPSEAVGKQLHSTNNKIHEIIGVTKNFHIKSLHNKLEPITLQLHESKSWYPSGKILVRLNSSSIKSAMDHIKNELNSYSKTQLFEYEFLSDKLNMMYRTEQRLGKVVLLFTIISVLIACLGLYGLAAFSAERRMKEIGIRKVLGATITNVITLLSKDFLKLVFIGFIIATPVAFYTMNLWLNEFAYKVHIGFDIFINAGLIVLIITYFTVSWQSLRAALMNPGETLKRE